MDIGIESLQFDNASICVQFGVTLMFFGILFIFLSLIRGAFRDCQPPAIQPYRNGNENEGKVQNTPNYVFFFLSALKHRCNL